MNKPLNINSDKQRIFKTKRGFTLLEILIALFIFTILSMILTSALHNIITIQSSTEKHAERLRSLQMVMLMMSRDIEQAVNRPVLNVVGKEDPAFVGTPTQFTFTHTGLANPTGAYQRSSLQRTGYVWEGDALLRKTWSILDQMPQSQPHARSLLTDLTDTRFQYLDKNGRFYDNWPADGEGNQPLPRAVKISFTISQWGKISQLYVISAEPSNAAQNPPPPPPKS